MYLRPNTTDQAVYNQVWKQLEYDVPLRFEPKTILDLGAYTGISALWFAQQYQGVGIYCVEPDLGNYSTLLQNVQSYPNIRCLHGAVKTSRRTYDLRNNGDGEWGYTVVPAFRPENPVQGYTIPDLCRHWEIVPDIVKMDIEGSETDIFNHPDAEAWFHGVKAVYVECHGSAANAAANRLFNPVSWESSRCGENRIFISRRW